MTRCLRVLILILPFRALFADRVVLERAQAALNARARTRAIIAATGKRASTTQRAQEAVRCTSSILILPYGALLAVPRA